MKLRHPLTGDIYTRRDEDAVEVETTDGRRGTFTRKGVWLRGALREADPAKYPERGWSARGGPARREEVGDCWSLARGARRGSR